MPRTYRAAGGWSVRRRRIVMDSEHPEGRLALLHKEPPPTGARRGRLRYGLTDLLVVAACSLVFVVAMGPVRHIAAKGPPIAKIAQELGTTPEQFQQVADRYLPRCPAGPPTEAQKRQVATALNISVDRLDTVMEKYRPDRLHQQ